MLLLILSDQTSDYNLSVSNRPLSQRDNLGKEVITRLDTSIKTAEYFYTDSNGREMLQRK